MQRNDIKNHRFLVGGLVELFFFEGYLLYSSTPLRRNSTKPSTERS